MLFSIDWLSTLFPNFQGNIDEHINVKAINTDSRQEVVDSLFIPIVGESLNGHAYVEQAIEQGAVAVLWEEQEELPASIPKDFPVFFTKDTTEGLQEISKKYRDEINPIVIGITGSNGKTTTKDLVASIMETTFRTHYTKGNLNNHIGLPLTILDMPRGTEVLVLEMGMSEFGEIDLLTKIARPDYAIITNIGESHIEFLGSREGIAKAKMEILNGLKENSAVIIDGDEALLKSLHKKENTITCGYHSENNRQITSTTISVDGTTFQLASGKAYQVPLFGKHHARNAIFAIIVAEKLGVSNENIMEGLQNLSYTSMRFELIEAKNGAIVVNDAYNASPTSMVGAIDVVKQMEGFHKKVLVLGDIFELGDFAEIMHRSIGQAIERPITHLYTLGDYAKFITAEVNQYNQSIVASHFESKDKLVHALKEHMTKDSIILFKASRGLTFETMVEEILEEKR